MPEDEPQAQERSTTDGPKPRLSTSDPEFMAVLMPLLDEAIADFWRKLRESKANASEEGVGAPRGEDSDSCYSLYEDEDGEEEE